MTLLEAAGLIGSTVATIVLIAALVIALDYLLRFALRRLP